MFCINAIVLCFAIILTFGISLTATEKLKASESIPSRRTINSFACPQQFGYYPDSTDCGKYYVCSFGLALHKNCTHGLYFSIQLQNCDWPLNVLCENDYKTDKDQDSYSVVEEVADKPKNDNKPIIEIKPLITNTNIKPKESRSSRPKPRLPTVNIQTYVPETSAPVTEAYNPPNAEYTIGSQSEASGPKPRVNIIYSIENFNNTDSRTNYNLDSIYQPLSTVAPTVSVDGFDVPLTQTLKSSEQNLKYETTPSPIILTNINPRISNRPTNGPQTQLNPSISYNRNSYSTDSPKSYYSETNDEKNDRINDNYNNENNYTAYDGVSNVRIEPNYYHYEDVGSSPVRSINRERNNYDLPPIEKPLTDYRNEFISSRSIGSDRSYLNRNNNNNDFVTTTEDKMMTPSQYYRQLYSNAPNSRTTTTTTTTTTTSTTTTTTPKPVRYEGENILRSTIVRPHYQLPAIDSTNNKPNNDSENIYVFVKPLKDNRIIERLTRLRNSESRPQPSENPYNTVLRPISPIVRIVRKKPKPLEALSYSSVLENNPKAVDLSSDVLSTAVNEVNTPKSTTELPSVYQRQRLGQQEYFKLQNRSPRVLESYPEDVNNQRDVNRHETNDNNSHRETNRQTFDGNYREVTRGANREVLPVISYKQPERPDLVSNYEPEESLRPKQASNKNLYNRPEYISLTNNRDSIRPEVPQNRPEVPQNRPEVPQNRPEVPQNRPEVPQNRPEVSQNRPELLQNRPEVTPNRPEFTYNRQQSPQSRPESPQNRLSVRPDSVQNYNQREVNRQELIQNQRSVNRQELKPIQVSTEKPERIRDKPSLYKPKVSLYQPEVIPPYELEIRNQKVESPVGIPFDMRDVSRDAVVMDYGEFNKRDRSYMDFLGFANSPKLNPNSIRIIEMPLTTKRPSFRHEWNSNVENNNLRHQLIKNDTIPHNLRFKAEDAVTHVVPTQKPTYRDEGYGRSPQTYNPTFRPDISPSPGYTGEDISRVRSSRPQRIDTPEALPLIREQPPLQAPPTRPTLPVLNKVEVITSKPKPETPPKYHRLRTYRPLITIEDDRKPSARSVQNGNHILSDSLPKIETNIRDINDLRRNYTEIKPYAKYNEPSLPLTSRNEINSYTTQKPTLHSTSYPKTTRKNYRYFTSIQKPISTSTTTTTTTTTTAAPTTTAVPLYDYYYEDITEDKNSVTLPSTRKAKTTTTNSRHNYRYKTTTTPKPIEYDYEYDDYHSDNSSIPGTARSSITTTVRAYKTTTTTTTQTPITRPSLYSSGRKPRPTNRRLVIKDSSKEPPKLASRPKPIYPTPKALSHATKCDAKKCKLPDCRCGGSDIPAGLSAKNIPQIVLITFDDAVNDLNSEIYEEIFEQRFNPNGCPIRGTFYVSHEWTDYGQVQTLYAKGHEIASHGITHSFGEKFSKQEWIKEVNGQREIIHLYGGVKLEDIRGMRAPFLQTGGNRMFEMLHESNFTYDSSLPVFENSPPFWPYTLDYALNHECMIPPCPTKSFPGVWEVGMVMWQDLRGGRCSMGDACTNPTDEIGVYDMLLKNFNRHYKSNRAPFNLYYHSAWFNTHHHKKAFIKFLDEIIQRDDVYIITNWQMIQWVRNPTKLDSILDFEPWKCSQKIDDNPCNHPTVCNVNSKNGARSLRTCQPCPSTYPWVGNTGFKSSNYG